MIETKFKAASSHLKFELFSYICGGGVVILPTFNLISCCVSESSPPSRGNVDDYEEDMVKGMSELTRNLKEEIAVTN